MAEKLPWFPFYALDWITDPRVQGLSNEQRGVYHWLLCRQWLDGDIPEEPILVYPLLPPGSDSQAVVYILDTFFPIVGGGKRRNARLSDVRDEQEAKRTAKGKSLTKARAAKAAKHRQDKQLQRSVDRTDIRAKIQSQIKSLKEQQQLGVSRPEETDGQ